MTWPQAAPGVLDLYNLGEGDTSPIKEQYISPEGHDGQQMSSLTFFLFIVCLVALSLTDVGLESRD